MMYITFIVFEPELKTIMRKNNYFQSAQCDGSSLHFGGMRENSLKSQQPI